MKHMAEISKKTILLKSDYQLNGALTENYVLQQIKSLYDTKPKCYASTTTYEIDFIIQDGMNIIPIELKQVKALLQKASKNISKSINPKR